MALKIEIYSDVICPWCFLGKRRLEESVQALGEKSEVEISYLPFELNPSTPLEGVDRKKYLEDKYGGSIHSAHHRLEQMGKEAGIHYDFESQQKIPNTFNAHRVIWLAEKEGVQAKVVEALFSAYFTEARDLGDKKVLADAAASAGLNRAKVEKLLEGETGTEEVRALEEKAYNLGITGVPFFVFNGKSAVSGAQSQETFNKILAELTA